VQKLLPIRAKAAAALHAATIFQTAFIKMVYIRCRQNDACIKIDMGFWQKNTDLLKKALIKDGLILPSSLQNRASLH